jgi:very-short-patch-repair endonuclease
MTGIHPITRQRAKKLRAEMTPQERKVWGKLRELNRMLGLHFRRQVPIGPFIADFADLGRRLVIEIDGGGHGGERDRQRDEWLVSQGFQVLRFWNPEVSGNIEGVMQLVLDAVGPLTDAPPPQPSPTRGEGGATRLASNGIVGAVPPTPIPSPRGGGEVLAAGVERNGEGRALPSPRVGEGKGGGALAKGPAQKGSAQ